MKLFYQLMLGFLLIIFSSLTIIGYSSTNYYTEQAYNQSYDRLEGYADSLEQVVLSQKNPAEDELDAAFLDKLQIVMQGEDTTLRIFNRDNHLVYPHSPMQWKLPKDYFNKLKKGKTIRIKNDHKNAQLAFSDHEAYTSVLVPWFDKGKLIGVIWIGSRVQNVEEVIIHERRNLLTALLITAIIAIVLSFMISYFISLRLRRLSQATKKIAQGNFNVHLSNHDVDELDELAQDFNSMAFSLKRANDEVQAQEKRRDEFMADVAHEMRTPLTTINGLIEGLKYNAIPTDSVPQSLDLMQSETKRLIRLVNENLDYEKIRNNQIKLYKTEFNAYPTLRNLLTQMNQKAKDKNDKLKLVSPKKLPIYADKDRFTQILVNLVQNALQFTENGKITISGKRIEHGTQIEVKDTGIGMDEKQKKYIFERFYKADPSRAKLGSGESGLGLSIVMSLIKQHGGEIAVESKPGEGATFIVTFYDKGYKKNKDKQKN